MIGASASFRAERSPASRGTLRSMSSYGDLPPRLQLLPEGPASLFVRPDQLRVDITARVLDVEVSRALALLEPAVEHAMRELVEAVPGARLELVGFELRRGAEKVSRGGSEIAAVVCSGHITAPLLAGQTYWQRARIVAALHSALAASATAGARLKQPVHLGHTPAVALLADPEQHRRALIDLWLGRARELADRTQALGLSGGLHLRECNMPAPVEQHPHTLEQVELRLTLAGPLAATPIAAPGS
jgi:hypothetical protein